MTRYSTRDEAIQSEIVRPIEAGAAKASEFDIEAIAAKVLGDYAEGYALQVTTEEFWAIVAENAR